MQTESHDLLIDLAIDPFNGWSIGSFGAIGEFVRDADEIAEIGKSDGNFQIATRRGAMRIAPSSDLHPVAWDSLSADGESWGHALAFCVPVPPVASRTIEHLGTDVGAVCDKDRGHELFDLGVGHGAVRMCLRTADEALIAALTRAEGAELLSLPDLMPEVLRAQPHRVMLSPAGRIEVFQPIPPANGKSPAGPHTHLLPKLIVKDRPHSSNVPIPDGLQSVLTIHPRSPWRTMMGERHSFDAAIDKAFAALLRRYGLDEDARVEATLMDAIDRGATPEFATWPDTRRGRTKARIVLRRLAAANDPRVKPWRSQFDRAPVEIEEGEEA